MFQCDAAPRDLEDGDGAGGDVLHNQEDNGKEPDTKRRKGNGEKAAAEKFSAFLKSMTASNGFIGRGN